MIKETYIGCVVGSVVSRWVEGWAVVVAVPAEMAKLFLEVLPKRMKSNVFDTIHGHVPRILKKSKDESLIMKLIQPLLYTILLHISSHSSILAITSISPVRDECSV